MVFCRERPYVEPEPTVPVGTTYTITESSEWVCPASGNWQIELHGGGGGGASDLLQNIYATGGGSGEIYLEEIQFGTKINVTIGVGGIAYQAGQPSNFANISLSGGGGGQTNPYPGNGGSASGSIATAGTAGRAASISIGLGNINNTSQSYGNGGSPGESGQSGAAIITFLG